MSRAPRNRTQHPPIVNKPEFSLLLVLRLLRVLAHMLYGVLLALVTGLFFMAPRPWHQGVIVYWLKGLTRVLNLHVEIDGQPTQQAALWVSNHVSWMDIPVLGSVQPVSFLSKAEVAKWPVIGRLAVAAGTLFIQRGSGDSARVREQMQACIAGEHSVLFFPEGTTTDGHRVHRFFPKLFEVAVLGQSAVQPMVICYRLGEGLHPWAPFIGDDDLVAHLLHILAGEPIRVQVAFLDPVLPEGRTALELSRHCEQLMAHRLNALHNDAPEPSRLHYLGINKA